MIRTGFPCARWIALAAAMFTLHVAALAQESADSSEDPGDGDPVWTLYDVRDLRAVLPREGEEESDGAEYALMDRLCTALGLSFTPVAAGVVAVEANPREHQRLRGLLGDVKQFYTERYVLDLAIAHMPAASAPSVGDEVSGVEPTRRSSFVLQRRTQHPVGDLEEWQMVRAFQPVAAQGVAAYEGQLHVVRAGNDLLAIVGAGDDTSEGASLSLTGELIAVDGGRAAATPETSLSGPTVVTSGPRVSRRPVRGDLFLRYGRPTVVAVAAGFSDNQSIVIWAVVRKLPDEAPVGE